MTILARCARVDVEVFFNISLYDPGVDGVTWDGVISAVYVSPSAAAPPDARSRKAKDTTRKTLPLATDLGEWAALAVDTRYHLESAATQEPSIASERRLPVSRPDVPSIRTRREPSLAAEVGPTRAQLKARGGRPGAQDLHRPAEELDVVVRRSRSAPPAQERGRRYSGTRPR